MVVRVAIDAFLDRLFDYSVPMALADKVKPGQRIKVPFGKRIAIGYIIELLAQDDSRIWTPENNGSQNSIRGGGKRITSSESASTSANPLPGANPREVVALDLFGETEIKSLKNGQKELRDILAIEDPQPFLSEALLRLCRWMASYYCAPIEAAIRCALPAPVREKGAKAREQLFVSMPEIKSKGANTPGSEAPALTSRQQALLDNLKRVGGGTLQALCREFKCAPETIKRLAEGGHVILQPRQMRRDPLANRKIMPTTPMQLMPEQAAALEKIMVACDQAEATRALPQNGSGNGPESLTTCKPVLLFGVTASGKTEVYLQVIAHVLAKGQGAIVMVPEIALTPQTVQRFAGRFGDSIAVLHSALSDGERHDEWHRIRNGEARVVVGPRSAVFAPVANLGLIVVDEEHEPSYKQDETPRYNGRDVAVMRAHLEKCAVVLGSATPAMESWFNATTGKYTLAALANRVEGRPMPHVHIVDMRIETARSGHVQIFSQQLVEAMQARLNCGEQIILFLNRRGYATSLVCTKCGFVSECDACSVAYTFHKADDCLRCHLCGDWKRVPPACPSCGDPAFKYAGFGTQRAEAALQKIFPQARIARMDADVTARKHSHDEILGAFRTGRTDILLGTQMIAKGLDFPNVTLVGVLVADASLHMPDFRAGERTFQLLAQVSGRAGRGETPGEVFVQTYTPNHPAVKAAVRADFVTFAGYELAERKEAAFPPYTRLACINLRCADEEKLIFTSNNFAKELAKHIAPGVHCSEAMPAPLARAKGVYRYQILLRARQAQAINKTIRAALQEIRLPSEVGWSIDMDALSLM